MMGLIIPVWRADPTDMSLRLRIQGFFPRGFDPWTRNVKYLWDALCLPPTRRISEVGGAEPEIWRSPNQKRSITIPNAEKKCLTTS